MSRLFHLKYDGGGRFICRTDHLHFEVDPADLLNADVFFCRANPEGWEEEPDPEIFEQAVRDALLDMSSRIDNTLQAKLDVMLLHMDLLDAYPLTMIIERLESFRRSVT